ncbi:MAG: sugar-binding protein [Armatimonadota bacterium]
MLKPLAGLQDVHEPRTPGPWKYEIARGMFIMRRLLIAAALLMTASVFAAPRVPTPHATIGKTASPPVIDGVLDDACWDEERPAVLTHFVDLYMNDVAPVETRVLVAYDAENLYIGACCEEPEIDRIRRDFHERDDPVWRDDCIEIFIDTNRDAKSYVHFAINSNGAVYDERRPGDASYDADITAEGSVGDAEWMVECAIALSDLKVQGEPGQTWGFNIGRERNPGDEPLSAWSATYGKFLVPERFGTITLAESAVPVLWQLPADPAFGPCDVQIATATEVSPDLEVLRNWPEKAARSWEHPAPQVEKSDEQMTGLPHTWQGQYRLVDGTEYALVVRQSQGENVLFRQAAPIHISPEPGTAALAAHITALEASVDSFGEFSGPAAEMLEEARTELQGFAEANIERQQSLPVDEWRTVQAKHASLLGQLRGLSYIVWRRSPLEGLQRTQMPDQLYPPRMIDLAACGNEKESATFVVSNPTSETFEGRISVGDLQFTSAAEVSAVEDRNLLKNGDFAEVEDNIPAGWRRVQAEAAYRVETSPDGKNTFILSGPENEQASANVRQTVDLKPGTQYTLIAELSAENLGPGGGQVYVINEGWTWSTSVRPLTPTSGRREYVRTFTPPESSSYEVVLRLSSPTGGAMKFHSVKIIEGDVASSTFSSDCITMHEVLYQDLRMARTVADPIPEMDGARTLMIPPGESRQVWMDIDTAALPPGSYSTSVRVVPMDTDLPTKSVPITFEVLPVRLPEKMPIAVYNWDYA